MQAGRTRLVVNNAEAPTAEFTRNRDSLFPGADMHAEIGAAVGAAGADFVDATRLATALFGDAIATNLFLLGFALAEGLRAGLGRRARARDRAERGRGRCEPAGVPSGAAAPRTISRGGEVATPAGVIPIGQRLSRSLDETIARRVEFLTDYQDAAYAARYRALVDRVRQVESDRGLGTQLAEAVARYYFKLLAYKDEYEVARLYTRPEFRARSRRRSRATRAQVPPRAADLRQARPGHRRPRKREFGPWMLSAFRVLAKLKCLRGTAFDVSAGPRSAAASAS